MKPDNQFTDEQRLEKTVARKRVADGAEVFFVSEVMPEVIAGMARQQAKWAAFCDSLRGEFAAAPAVMACARHSQVLREKLFEETCQQSRAEGRFCLVWATCPECVREEKRRCRWKYWRGRGMPERVLGATLGSFVAESELQRVALEGVRGWLKRRGLFLMLRGTPGTGKGHLAAACLKAYGDGLWVTHAGMLAELRASYTTHTTGEVIARWQETPCLVIDELGVSAGGRDEEAMFYQTVAERHDKRRPTIFTTNQTRQEYHAVLGYRLVDRVAEDCEVVNCVWESWRRKGKDEG